MMNRVVHIVLLTGIRERLADFERRDEPWPITRINAWLAQGQWKPLTSLHEKIETDQVFGGCVYAAALERLKIPAFLEEVARQNWDRPDGLLLMLKNGEEPAFRIYRLKDSTMVLVS